MAKMKPLLPSELEGECVVKNERWSMCAIMDGGGIKIRERGRKIEAATVGKKRNKMNKCILFTWTSSYFHWG